MPAVQKLPPLQLLIGGRWIDGARTFSVYQKYTQKILADVSEASVTNVDEAILSARRGFSVFSQMPAYERAEILRRVSSLLQERRETMAQWISMEVGKAIKFSRLEVDRAIDTFRLASEEAGRIHGETVPMDAVKSGQGLIGFWHRRPVGVVAAITPFNFPLNLVAHKVAPALAAGNAVVLKPAELTPLTAALLCEILIEAGLPEGCINLVHGPGESIGSALIKHPGVDKITFTGSALVGRKILASAGIRKVTLELGNASPVIIAADADLETAAAKCALGANYNSGQVCISTQRIYVEEKAFGKFRDLLVEETKRLKVGDPLDESMDVGPLIQEKEALRVQSWVHEAVGQGASVLIGDRREGSMYWPTVIENTRPDMKVIREEVFGPVASIVSCSSFENALDQADDTEYGLQASVFTRDLDRAFQAVRRLNFGGIVINDTPHLRPDHIPYGGNRQSGLGREGVRFAVEEMTNIQMVQIRTPTR